MLKIASWKNFVNLEKDTRINGLFHCRNRRCQGKTPCFFCTATGKTLLKRLIFDNTIEGFNKLLDQAKVIQTAHDLKKVVFGLEPTANYHKPLGEYLIRCGKMVVFVAGISVKRNRELLDGRWDKNDDKDAANVADLISQGKCLFYEYPVMGIRDLRNLLSLQRKLRKQEHGYRVRIRNQLIAQYFPELDRYSGYAETESIVRWCLDPSRIAGFENDKFETTVASGRQTLAKKKRLDDIQKLAVASIGCEIGEGASVVRLTLLYIKDMQCCCTNEHYMFIQT